MVRRPSSAGIPSMPIVSAESWRLAAVGTVLLIDSRLGRSDELANRRFRSSRSVCRAASPSWDLPTPARLGRKLARQAGIADRRDPARGPVHPGGPKILDAVDLAVWNYQNVHSTRPSRAGRLRQPCRHRRCCSFSTGSAAQDAPRPVRRVGFRPGNGRRGGTVCLDLLSVAVPNRHFPRSGRMRIIDEYRGGLRQLRRTDAQRFFSMRAS